MSFLDKIVGKLAPHQCLACGAEGNLLCRFCINLFADLPDRCYRCRRPSPANITCPGCAQASPVARAVAVTEYEGMAKDLVWRLKFAGQRATTAQLVSCLQPLLAQLIREQPVKPEAVIVPLPTTASRARQRGFDQARLLARELSKRSKLNYMDCLGRQGQAHQVGANRDKRLAQLNQAFRVTKPFLVSGAHLILVDDVLTTGATLEAAAHALKRAGARRIEAITFAQA